MKSLFSAKPILVAAVAFGALAAASAARADLAISVGLPGAYVQHAQPVYVQPQGHYYQGRERRDERGNWGDADHDGVPNVYDPNSRHYNARAAFQVTSPWGDADRDGLPNWRDRDSRFYQAHADRPRVGGWGDADRDGVPNRFDHAPHNPYRR